MPTLYADDGSIRATIVSGITPVGAYAADGSWNLIESTPTTYGLHHPSGAKYITIVTAAPTTAPIPLYAANGSWNVTLSPLRVDSLPMITIVAGSLSNLSISGTAGTLDINFLNNRATLSDNSTIAASSVITFSRSSTALAQERNGNWTTYASGTPRINSRGILIEQQRTNSVVNSTFQGAVVGSTLFSMAGYINTGAGDGISTLITGTGTQNGLPYLDVRFFGTVLTGGIVTTIQPQANSTIVANCGQVWSASCTYQLIDGTFNFLSPSISLGGVAADLVTVFENLTTDITSDLNSGAPFRVYSNNVRQNISTAYLSFRYFRAVTPAAGTVVDFTIRFSAPQVEHAYASGVQTAAATVVAGGAGYTIGDVLTMVGGAFSTASQFTVTGVSAGAVTSVSVTLGGSYTTYPSTFPVAVTGGTGAGATFNPIPIVLIGYVAEGTSPILTTGVAATRSADFCRVIGTNFTSAFAEANYTTYFQVQHILGTYTKVYGGLSNEAAPSFNNCMYFSSGPTASFSYLAGGLGQVTAVAPSVSDGRLRGTLSIAAGDASVSINSSSGVDAAVTIVAPGTFTRLVLGSASWNLGSNNMNSYFERFTLWNVTLSDADVQELGTRTII